MQQAGGERTRWKVAVINKGSKKIVFVSHQLKNYFIKNYGFVETRAEVIYNGIDTNKFTPGKNNALKEKLGLASDDILIGSIGNIRPAKGYDILLRAAAEVKKQRRDVKFVIAGQGSGELYHELLGLRETLNLLDTVFFLGFTENTVIFCMELICFCSAPHQRDFLFPLLRQWPVACPLFRRSVGGQKK